MADLDPRLEAAIDTAYADGSIFSESNRDKPDPQGARRAERRADLDGSGPVSHKKPPPNRWFGLHQERTLHVDARFVTPSGRVAEVCLSKRDLLELLGDAAHMLAKIEQAEQMNRERATGADQ